MAASGSTPNYSINYPQGSDSVSLAADLQEMATDIDSVLLSKLNTSGGTMTGALVGTAITDSSSSTTGAFKTAGGMGIAKSLNVGQNANITGNVDISGTLTLATKTITLGGNFATSGAYNATLTLTDATNVTLPTTGTLATLAGSETLSNKTLTTPNIGAATGTSVALTGAISTDSTTNATSTTTGSIQTDGGIGVAKDVYVGGSVIAVNTPGHNLLHNGAMQIHQRGTSTASITTSGYFTADRWDLSMSSLGTWTNSIENDAPTGSGFRKSLKMLCTTADASPAAGDWALVEQRLEGQNLQSVKKGTADAQPLTLSFWVKSNKTGVYVVELADADNLRNVSATYTVNASGTWEQKTVTFPADTTGAFDNDNALSLALVFWLAAGSDRTSGTLATSWAAWTAANRAVGQTNLASNTNQYLQLTGVQLEAGSVQTPYDFKSYEQELRECQRYYETGFFRMIGYGGAGGYLGGMCFYKVPKRANPTIVQTNLSTFNTSSTTNYAVQNGGHQAYRAVTALGNADFSEDWTASADL